MRRRRAGYLEVDLLECPQREKGAGSCEDTAQNERSATRSLRVHHAHWSPNVLKLSGERSGAERVR